MVEGLQNRNLVGLACDFSETVLLAQKKTAVDGPFAAKRSGLRWCLGFRKM